MRNQDEDPYPLESFFVTFLNICGVVNIGLFFIYNYYNESFKII